MIILEKLSFSKPLKTTAKTKPSHTKGGQWGPHWPKTLQHVLKRASPFWVTLAALVPSVIILHHFKSHWLSFFFPTVISYNLPMMSSMLSSSSSAFISVNCISLYGLHWNDYTAKQFVTMHLKKIIGHMTSACVCVRMCTCVDQKLSCGPLFSAGPSNPFKSALLIPLSSHCARDFMQAHTRVLTTVYASCVFFTFQNDLFRFNKIHLLV